MLKPCDTSRASGPVLWQEHWTQSPGIQGHCQDQLWHKNGSVAPLHRAQSAGSMPTHSDNLTNDLDSCQMYKLQPIILLWKKQRGWALRESTNIHYYHSCHKETARTLVPYLMSTGNAEVASQMLQLASVSFSQNQWLKLFLNSTLELLNSREEVQQGTAEVFRAEVAPQCWSMAQHPGLCKCQ